jgi:hypothetical protein
VVAVLRMAERELAVHLVLVAPPHARLGQIAGLLQIADDLPHGALGDADGVRDVAQPSARVSGDAREHMGVVRDEPPRVITDSGS